jgi:UDP-N-acetylmuramate--alanine ligase
VYEADEFARNFLSFHPALGVITGIDWDHPDIYPTRLSYNAAFEEFLDQTTRDVIWDNDVKTLGVAPETNMLVLKSDEPAIDKYLRLPGRVNRLNAWLAAQAIVMQFGVDINRVVAILNAFPGVSRRFEKIQGRLYSDYAHTPPKIRGALDIAKEIEPQNIVVVYEGLHNTRQHFIKAELEHLFDDVKQLYIVPSYMAREDPNLEVLTPEKLKLLLSPAAAEKCQPMQLNDELKAAIQKHMDANDLVLCLSAGGGGSLDEWLRLQFSTGH